MRSPWYFIQAFLGMNPHLPFADEVENPVHGVQAKNSRRQKVIYDENQGGKWVLPQNFSGSKPVTIK
jgi:hypothetical protein